MAQALHVPDGMVSRRPAAGGPSARLRQHLMALGEGRGGSSEALEHMAAAVAALDEIEALARGALAAVRETAAARAMEVAGFELALTEAREAKDAALAGREVAVAQREAALTLRERAMAALRAELEEVHGEAVVLERERDGARHEVRTLSNFFEEALERRDRIICEMHEEIAEAYAEAFEAERTRDAARARAEAAEAWNEDLAHTDELRAELAEAHAEVRRVSVELDDSVEMLRRVTLELSVLEAERDTYRARLRDAVEAARAGRLGDFVPGGRFATVRAERVGNRRLARTTSELSRRGPNTGTFPRIERTELRPEAQEP